MERAAAEFFLYFPAEEKARRVARRLERRGYGVEVTAPSEGIREWSVVAKKEIDPGRLWAIELRLGLLARVSGGEYDGNAVAVD